METRDKERIRKEFDIKFCYLTNEANFKTMITPSQVFDWFETTLDQQLQKMSMDNLAVKTEQIKKWEAVADSWKEQLAKKEEHIISLKAIIDKLSESDNDVTMAKELAEKDKEISVKTKIIDHWRNEAGAFDLVCQKQSKEIASLKEEIENLKAVLQGETQLLRSAEEYAAGRNAENERLKEALRKAKLYVLPVHGLYKEIENLLK